jgi:hypothetical protein
MKSLIIYVYIETQETKENLHFFIKNGIIKENNYRYVFLINNNLCSLEFPNYENVEVIYREENCGDIYTYNWFIEKKKDDYFLDYSNIYFINSSCLGPFISPYCSSNWIDICNEMLKNYELIGPVCEIPPDNLGFTCMGLNINKNIPFIHSYMFGVNRKGFTILKNNLFNNMIIAGKLDLIFKFERKITSSILLNGGRIKSFLTRFKNVDLNNQDNWITEKWNLPGLPSCYEVPNNYFGIDLNPFEIMFVKNIRNCNEVRSIERSYISPKLKLELLKYKEWM